MARKMRKRYFYNSLFFFHVYFSFLYFSLSHFPPVNFSHIILFVQCFIIVLKYIFCVFLFNSVYFKKLTSPERGNLNPYLSLSLFLSLFSILSGATNTILAPKFFFVLCFKFFFCC